MNVLLTHGYFLEDDAKEQQIMRPYPPLGILYIAAFLDRHQIDNTVFDTTFSNQPTFHKYLVDHNPRIIGIYVNLMTKKKVLASIKFIQKNLSDSTIILGGPDVRFNAFDYLSHGAHYVVNGEGEETMLELVTSILQGRATKHITGISYLNNEGKLEVTNEREKIRDLDELPLPARQKIDLHRYLQTWKKFHGQSAISISTMRGCPYTCKWCSRSVYGLSYRRRSAHKVAEELLQIKQTYNPDTLWFVDDVFTISHRWLEDFREQLTKHGVNISYECITRADRLNEKVLRLLKETGCFRIWIGAESGSQKVIDLMDRRVHVQQVRDMIRLSKEIGMQSGTFIMLGYPGETEDDIEETISHLKECDPDHFTITVAYPIKGTDLYNEVHSKHSEKLAWSTSTDRDIDFERTYKRKYYDYAMIRVNSEMRLHRMRGRFSVSHTKEKLKSLTAKTGMMWYRLVSKMTI